MKLVAAMAFCSMSSTALAQPVHPGESVPDPAPEPSPPAVAAPTSVTPPIVTISTMPVSTTIPGSWDDKPRTAAWIATGAAGATLAAAVTWYFIYNSFTHVDKQYDVPCPPNGTHGVPSNCSVPNVPLTEKQQRKQDIYAGVELGLGIATRDDAGRRVHVVASLHAEPLGPRVTDDDRRHGLRRRRVLS